MEQKKVTYSDLTWPLKGAIIISWLIGVLYLVAFFVGFFLGVTS